MAKDAKKYTNLMPKELEDHLLQALNVLLEEVYDLTPSNNGKRVPGQSLDYKPDKFPSQTESQYPDHAAYTIYNALAEVEQSLTAIQDAWAKSVRAIWEGKRVYGILPALLQKLDPETMSDWISLQWSPLQIKIGNIPFPYIVDEKTFKLSLALFKFTGEIGKFLPDKGKRILQQYLSPLKDRMGQYTKKTAGDLNSKIKQAALQSPVSEVKRASISKSSDTPSQAATVSSASLSSEDAGPQFLELSTNVETVFSIGKYDELTPLEKELLASTNSEDDKRLLMEIEQELKEMMNVVDDDHGQSLGELAAQSEEFRNLPTRGRSNATTLEDATYKIMQQEVKELNNLLISNKDLTWDAEEKLLNKISNLEEILVNQKRLAEHGAERFFSRETRKRRGAVTEENKKPFLESSKTGITPKLPSQGK